MNSAEVTIQTGSQHKRVLIFHKNDGKISTRMSTGGLKCLYQLLSIDILKYLILKIFNILLRLFWRQSNIGKYSAQREPHAEHSPIKKHKALSRQLLIYLASIARRLASKIRLASPRRSSKREQKNKQARDI